MLLQAIPYKMLKSHSMLSYRAIMSFNSTY